MGDTDRSIPRPNGYWSEKGDFWVRPRSGYGADGSYTGMVCRVCGKRTNGKTGRRGDQAKLHHKKCVLYSPAVEADEAWAREQQAKARRYLLSSALRTAEEVLRLVDAKLLSQEQREIWSGCASIWREEYERLGRGEK